MNKTCHVVMVSMGTRTGKMAAMPAVVFTYFTAAEAYVRQERKKDENKFMNYDILEVTFDSDGSETQK